MTWLRSRLGPGARPQAGDEVVREPVGDFLRARGTFRAVPPRNPVDGAENREREELRVSLGERAGPDALLEHFPHAAIEPVTARDDGLEVRWRPGFEIEGQGGAVQLVENRVDEGDDQPADLLVGRKSAELDLAQERE